ncbi:MAG: hypothetical protein J2P13_02715 [Acidobacteria bacterium]|nr:hypothetical protein [Acidobacteriota bacterium]
MSTGIVSIPGRGGFLDVLLPRTGAFLLQALEREQKYFECARGMQVEREIATNSLPPGCRKLLIGDKFPAWE